MRCSRRKKSRAWATVASAAGRLLSRLRCKPRAAPGRLRHPATSSASSTRRSVTAGRSRSRTSGCAAVIRGDRQAETTYRVGWGGHTEHHADGQGRHRVRWVPHRLVKAWPTTRRSRAIGSTPATRSGCGSAEAVESFNFQAFNTGEYYAAVQDKVLSETVSKVTPIPTTSPGSARSCGSRSSTSSFPARCRHVRTAGAGGDPPTRFAEAFPRGN